MVFSKDGVLLMRNITSILIVVVNLSLIENAGLFYLCLQKFSHSQILHINQVLLNYADIPTKAHLFCEIFSTFR